jgi:hypothetical protein
VPRGRPTPLLLLLPSLLGTALCPPARAAAPDERPEAATPATPPAHSPDQLDPIRTDLDKIRGNLAALANGLALSGFVVMQADTYAVNPNAFSLGLELDLARRAGANVQIAAALAVSEKGAALAAAFLDLHFLGGLVSPRGTLWPERGFRLQAGRFDLPFGNDWRYYQASSRLQLGAPLTTATVLEGGLTDLGVRAYGSSSWLNYAAYVTRGYGKGNAFGGRLEVAPFDAPFTLRAGERNRFELAFCYLIDLDDGGDLQRRLGSIDFDARLGMAHLRGELLDRRDADNTAMVAWQATLEGDLAGLLEWPLAVYGRYDHLRLRPADGPAFDRQQRVTIGALFAAGQGVSIKAECARNLEAGAVIQSRPGYAGNACAAGLVVSF